MRLLYVLSALVLVVSISGCQTGPSETDLQIVKNLKEVNQKLTLIDKQLKEIKKEVEDTNVPLPKMPVNFNGKGPDLRRLKKIKLPANADKKEIKDYIQKILSASQGQNHFSSTDPQIGMLYKVGSENVDLLLPYVQNYYVQTVLPGLVTEKDKKQILEALKVYPQLITCVIRKDWSKDAREIIFDRLKYSNGSYLPSEWITVAVEMTSPKEYGILKKYFVSCNDPETTYKALCQLENFDMKDAVDKAWNYQKRGFRSWKTKLMAIIAAKFGHKDALAYLINTYPSETNQYYIGKIQVALYQLTGKLLSPGKMAKWYRENEVDLVFDPEKAEYILKSQFQNFWLFPVNNLFLYVSNSF